MAKDPRDPDSADVPAGMFRHPPADISPDEFEDWVGELLESAYPDLEDLRITVHDKVVGTDGAFDLDASGGQGLDFLVVVEAKRHNHPIKRELVQVLHSKVQSTGAHKGVVIPST